MALFVILVETISQIFGETMTTQLKGIINATLVGRKNAEQKTICRVFIASKDPGV